MRYYSLKILAMMLSVAAIELSLAAACSAQSLPEPTGANSVGRITYPLVDGKHEYTVQVWYPAKAAPDSKPAPDAKPALEGKPAPWLPEDRVLLEQKGFLGMSLQRSSDPAAKDIPTFLASIVGHARQEVPLAASPKPFPVILFSAGSQTIPSTYSSLVEDLASRGFVVVGYGPTVIGLNTWKGDLTHILDQLAVWHTAHDHLFFDRLDLDHIGAFGHSAGGNAISTIAVGDKRLKAVVLIDPGTVRPEDGQPIPTLILKSEGVDFARQRPAIAAEKAKNQTEYARKGKPGLQITLLGAVHLSFTDMAVIKAFELPGDGTAFIDTSRAILGEFFAQYLEGKHSDLIEKGSPKYPLAKIESHE